MEEKLKARLDLIETHLNKILQQSTDLLKQLRKDGVNLDDLIKIKIKLKQAIDRYSEGINHYMEKTSDLSGDLITMSTAKQLEADEVLADLEATLAIHTAEKNQMSQTHNSKLPTLPPPKFSGDILLFHQFWDKFQATIDKRNLEDVHKMTYLMASLEGKALEVINGLEISNKNYAIAVEALQRQFGNKDQLIDAHHEALKNLPPALNNNDCRHTFNSIEHHLRVLETLGENIDGNHFRTTIKSKFPDQTLYELNMALDLAQNTVPDIRKTLDRIITAQERTQKLSLTVSLKPTVSSATALMQTEKKYNKDNYKRRPQLSSHNNKRKCHSSPSSGPAKKKSRPRCLFCNEAHYNNECTRYKTVVERKEKLGKRCYKCLRMGHNMRNCQIKKLCFNCRGNHHQALCPKTLKTSKDNIHTIEVCQTSCHINNTMSILQTATVNVRSKTNKAKCRLLLDSGSQRSYITTKMAKSLHLNADKEDLLIIYTFGSDMPQETSSPSVEINIETKRGITRKLRVNIVPLITERVPVPKLIVNKEFDIMADDQGVGEEINLLIGNDYYVSFIRNKTVKIKDCLFLIDTDFGWVLTGSADFPEEREGSLSVITYCQCHDPERLYFAIPDLPLRDTDMKFLWALESIGITDSAKTTREDEAVKHFTETVKYENGRYQVKWPWIDYPPDLPTNFGLAYGRLKSVVLRLDEPTLNEYKTILQKQLQNGIIEVIDSQTVKANQSAKPIHYLAHHIVKVKGKDGRIVYDASARTREQQSLNESLYKGPSMLEDLTSLLLKFRTDKIGITADVEKAFLQVGLQEEDRDVTRFLWLKDTGKEVSEDNIIHLRFCRVPFGIISSPFLLTATIRHHLSKTNKKLLPKVADRCYVDNLVTTASTTSSACDLYHETRKSFQELSMNIRDWTSNDQDFMKKIPEELRAKDTKVAKVLGLTWNIQDDSLQLKLNDKIFNELDEDGKSKRSVLRTLASFYDPCGFFSPLVLPAKILMQDLWRLKLSWDSPLPEHMITRWKSIVKLLQTAKDIRLPRYIGNDCSADETLDHDLELHCFTDASKHAHAAVVYLRVNGKTTSKSTLLMSKSRVNPVKEKEDLKIPRLELLGYVIGSRLLSYVRNVLEISVKKQFLWTDSLVVLSWMKSNKLLPPFVARRVNEIKQNPKLTMRYINSEQNPADVATRPELWSQKKSLWFQGPAFLSETNVPWPNENGPELQHSSSSLVAEGLDTEYPERPSDYEETITEQMESNIENVVQESSNPQIQEIINLQREHFRDEVLGKESHLSRNLGLFLDVDGILRCKGRVTHTDWTYEMKHPILLPKDSDFTTKVIRETHEKNYHVGVAHTLSIVRQKFWIPQGRAQVQKALRKCPQCVKHGGGPYALPPTPALPPERVTYSHPFTYTGIDYFGPMYVNTQQGKKKRWICLFTCLVVRAIHLEVVNDLTAQECLLALRRFVASKGIPTKIVSDNALQFKLISEVLGDTYCSQNNIEWKFIPQLAPWHGGVYERMVAVVKHCLKRTLEKHLLVDSQLVTVIKEVENVCNTRPLTYVGTEQVHILKPADFLSLGKCLEIENEEDHTPIAGTSAKQNLIEGWKRGQRIMLEFKSMFIGQYLSSLRERYHHSHKQPRVKSRRVPCVGDVVQLKDSAKNRENWKVGKISSLVKGPDGECRVAKVNVDGTEFTRSIGHLYPLEAEILEDKKQIEEHERTPGTMFETLEHSQNSEPEDEMTRPDEIPAVEPIAGRNLMDLDSVPLVEENVEKEQQIEIEQRESARDSNPVPEVNVPQVLHPTDTDSKEESNEIQPEVEGRSRREAAIRAKNKIAEWTRLLVAMLK